jgi:dihydrodipicolinate synthase/N-acetylneuraminate lyase
MLRGVIAPAIVFFDRKGDVDYANCKEHMDWMLSKGVKGLFVTGAYGSGYLLTREERMKIYELAMEAAEGYMGSFVIAHTACMDTASTASLTRSASQMGVYAVSAASPLIYNYTDDDVKRYYAAVIESSKAPAYADNNPAVTGRAFSLDLISDLKNMGVAGLKDSSISANLAALFCGGGDENDFQYIPGSATGWPLFRRLGMDALVAGMCNYMPELVVALYNASYEEMAGTEEIYRAMLYFAEKVKFGNRLVSSHICVRARGRDAGHARAPIRVDYEKNAARVKAAEKAIDEALAFLRETRVMRRV